MINGLNMARKEKATEIVKKNRWIGRNLLGGLIFVTVLFVGAIIGLNVLTRHGKNVQTPDFTNLTLEQAAQLAQEGHVGIKVVDSVFVRRLPGGVVYRQQPKAGSMVKKGRSIFLTINSVVPRKVVMPNLYGYSVAEARAELQNRGLNLGRLQYVRDIATNNVLGQTCQGKEVKAGDLVVSGSSIDLKVGLGKEDGQTQVPRLIGMKYVRAVDALHDRYLNVGRVVFDKDVRSYADSVNAVVYRQDMAGDHRTLGTPVNIWLTLDPAKLPAE